MPPSRPPERAAPTVGPDGTRTRPADRFAPPPSRGVLPGLLRESRGGTWSPQLGGASGGPGSLRVSGARAAAGRRGARRGRRRSRSAADPHPGRTRDRCAPRDPRRRVLSGVGRGQRRPQPRAGGQDGRRGRERGLPAVTRAPLACGTRRLRDRPRSGSSSTPRTDSAPRGSPSSASPPVRRSR